MTDPRRQKLQAFYPKVLNSYAGGDLEQRLREFVAADEIDHTAHVTGEPFRWTVESITGFVDSFVGLRAQAKHIVFMDDLACVHWSAAGRHVAPFAGYPATSQVETIEGVDLVRFQGDDICGHVGWIDQDVLNRELSVARDEPSGPSRPVEQALTSAGEALAAVSRQRTADDQPFGWRLELDAPRWALTKTADWAFLPALFLALAVAALGGGLLVLLWNLLKSSSITVPETVTVALAVGAGVSALALSLVSWRGISGWRALSSVHVDVRRTVPPRVDIRYEQTGEEGTRTVSHRSPGQQSGGGEAAPSEAAKPSNIVGKEPVLAGSTLIGGGTLALGLAGDLEPAALGAIAAAAIAVIGLLIRQLVMPVVSNQSQVQQGSDSAD